MRPSDSNHQTIASWIRTYLSDTFTNPMVQTVVLEKLGTEPALRPLATVVDATLGALIQAAKLA